MIQGYSHCSLVGTAVHVTVNDEIDVAGLGNPDNFDLVVTVIVPLIPLRIMEGEHERELVRVAVKFPQRIIRDKSDNAGA